MKYHETLVLMRRLFPRIDDAKLQAFSKAWAEGDRNFESLRRKSLMSRGSIEKARKPLKEAAAKSEARKARIEADAQSRGEYAVNDDSIAAPPEIIPRETPDGKTLISGPLFVSWIDELLEDAKENRNIRNLKLLHDMRASIIDFAAEMPVTHVDIERTVGLEGLAGMDSVLVDTLSLFFEDIDHYPNCKRFLSDTFNVNEDFWRRKSGDLPSEEISEKRRAAINARWAKPGAREAESRRAKKKWETGVLSGDLVRKKDD